jgi:cysteine synthase A
MDLLRAIGNTSMVRLQKFVPPGCATILAKLEWENPTGSLKDRMAQAVISRAEEDGRLRPGDTIIEYTGGSTGTSLAVAAIRVAEGLGPDATVVTLMADSGLKYLSTDVYRSK